MLTQDAWVALSGITHFNRLKTNLKRLSLLDGKTTLHNSLQNMKRSRSSLAINKAIAHASFTLRGINTYATTSLNPP
ncbi:MAG TPA: hypothetical protein V6D35_09300 [Candidatus Sericytochromatia bacterium]